MSLKESPARVVGVLASPHGSGSTAVVMDTFLSGAQMAGTTTNVIDLAKVTTADAIAAVEACDAVVFGSPTYRAMHTSLLGAFLEGVERGGPSDSTGPLAGKACAILMTGATQSHFLATGRLRAILTDFFACQVLAPSLYITPSSFHEDKRLKDAPREMVLAHGAALVDLAVAVRTSPAIRALRPLV